MLSAFMRLCGWITAESARWHDEAVRSFAGTAFTAVVVRRVSRAADLADPFIVRGDYE